MLEPETEEQHDQLKTLKMLASLLPAIKKAKADLTKLFPKNQYSKEHQAIK